MPRVKVVLHGTRGSLPLSGDRFREYGGNSICFEVRCDDAVLMFDAGSGIKPAGGALMAEGLCDFQIFFTHCHYDHIIGLPFFHPLYCDGQSIGIWSGHMSGRMTTEQMVRDFVRAPWFPVGVESFRARLDYHDFLPGDVLTPCPGIALRTCALNHPGGDVGYRVEFAGRSVAIVTDLEHVPGILDPAVLSLIRGADLMLYDAAYDEAEFARWRGFGHSTWQHGLALAQAAGVKRVGFIHHALWRGDAELSALEARAQAAYPGAFFGFDGQVLTF